MRAGGVWYWVIVAAVVLALVAGKSVYDAKLKREGYWMKGTNDVFVPLIIFLILGAIAAPKFVSYVRESRARAASPQK